jgi:small subunit ribosomal protein S9
MHQNPILVQAVGRRKEATAQVQILNGTGLFLINKKPFQNYLQNNSSLLLSIQAPFEILQSHQTALKFESLDTYVKVEGGGLSGQTEAIRLALSRAIAELAGEVEVRKSLKDKGYLTQDSRIKERKKYGLKKARKASQYHKR